jgi:RNA polymerase sigma-70 factor (ECF subfamily)
VTESQNTRWSLIQRAADGESAAREAFAERYESAIRAYLGARWRGTPVVGDLDDAVQDVFLDCFRDGGALVRAEPERPGGFRAYLYGIVRNVARRIEERRHRRREVQPGSHLDLGAIRAREEPLSRVFDRAWALGIVRQAARLQRRRAADKGEVARRRVEVLRRRYREGQPVRDIARDMNEDPVKIHADHARARTDFKSCLREVLRAHHPDSEVEAECARLLDLLG